MMRARQALVEAAHAAFGVQDAERLRRAVQGRRRRTHVGSRFCVPGCATLVGSSPAWLPRAVSVLVVHRRAQPHEQQHLHDAGGGAREAAAERAAPSLGKYHVKRLLRPHGLRRVGGGRAGKLAVQVRREQEAAEDGEQPVAARAAVAARRCFVVGSRLDVEEPLVLVALGQRSRGRLVRGGPRAQRNLVSEATA